MKVFHIAGAAALCGALLLTACAKKSTDQSTTSSTTDTTQSAAAASGAPVGEASPAPAATTTTTETSASTSSGNGASAGFIDVPVYPGATEEKDQGISSSSNGNSVAMKVYTSKDETKRVAEWYKSNLPSSWKNGILTAGGKTVGTFADEHKNGDGDQSVIVSNQDDGTTRIQITTKHGK